MTLDDAAFEVRFEEPVFALTPGQALVAYEGDRVVCGGTIDTLGPALDA